MVRHGVEDFVRGQGQTSIKADDMAQTAKRRFGEGGLLQSLVTSSVVQEGVLMINVAIIGGGISGLTATYELNRKGHP